MTIPLDRQRLQHPLLMRIRPNIEVGKRDRRRLTERAAVVLAQSLSANAAIPDALVFTVALASEPPGPLAIVAVIGMPGCRTGLSFWSMDVFGTAIIDAARAFSFRKRILGTGSLKSNATNNAIAESRANFAT